MELFAIGKIFFASNLALNHNFNQDKFREYWQQLLGFIDHSNTVVILYNVFTVNPSRVCRSYFLTMLDDLSRLNVHVIVLNGVGNPLTKRELWDLDAKCHFANSRSSFTFVNIRIIFPKFAGELDPGSGLLHVGIEREDTELSLDTQTDFVSVIRHHPEADELHGEGFTIIDTKKQVIIKNIFYPLPPPVEWCEYLPPDNFVEMYIKEYTTDPSTIENVLKYHTVAAKPEEPEEPEEPEPPGTIQNVYWLDTAAKNPQPNFIDFTQIKQHVCLWDSEIYDILRYDVGKNISAKLQFANGCLAVFHEGRCTLKYKSRTGKRTLPCSIVPNIDTAHNYSDSPQIAAVIENIKLQNKYRREYIKQIKQLETRLQNVDTAQIDALTEKLRATRAESARLLDQSRQCEINIRVLESKIVNFPSEAIFEKFKKNPLVSKMSPDQCRERIKELSKIIFIDGHYVDNKLSEAEIDRTLRQPLIKETLEDLLRTNSSEKRIRRKKHELFCLNTRKVRQYAENIQKAEIYKDMLKYFDYLRNNDILRQVRALRAKHAELAASSEKLADTEQRLLINIGDLHGRKKANTRLMQTISEYREKMRLLNIYCQITDMTKNPFTDWYKRSVDAWLARINRITTCEGLSVTASIQFRTAGPRVQLIMSKNSTRDKNILAISKMLADRAPYICVPHSAAVLKFIKKIGYLSNFIICGKGVYCRVYRATSSRGIILGEPPENYDIFKVRKTSSSAFSEADKARISKYNNILECFELEELVDNKAVCRYCQVAVQDCIKHLNLIKHKKNLCQQKNASR